MAARRSGWRYTAFGAAVLIHLVALYLPRAPGADGGPPLDKVAHVLLFAAVLVTGRWAGLRAAPLAAVLALHAGASELLQERFLPARQADPWDALADLVGVALGLLVPIGRSAKDDGTSAVGTG